jgi:ubiquinone/menaquinone biosynthesis C-methylase UbiE
MSNTTTESDLGAAIDHHYGSPNLTEKILGALREAGKDTENLRREDLSSFDEFHAGGLSATREMALFAEILPEDEVLDLGCGIGGPARTLTSEFDCTVTGLDITRSFCDAARELSRRLDMGDKVEFVCADAVEMPFPSERYDVVWAQYSMPNIKRQRTLFEQVYRVLKPGGSFVFESLCQGPAGEIHLPVFWAAEPANNHIQTPSDTRRDLIAAGLTEIAFEDVTEHVLIAARRRLAVAQTQQGAAALWLGLIVPHDAQEKMRNSIRNSEQGRTTVCRGHFRKPG